MNYITKRFLQIGAITISGLAWLGLLLGFALILIAMFPELGRYLEHLGAK